MIRPPSPFRPLIDLRGNKKEHVGRYQTQRLVLTIIEGLRSTGGLRGQVNDPKVGFGFWLVTPLKVAVEPKFKHHGNPLI